MPVALGCRAKREPVPPDGAVPQEGGRAVTV